MGKSSGGSSQRQATAEEKRLWDSQAKNLDSLTRIAEDQYDLSVEDREYYERVFRDGDDTEAKEAIAKLRSKITGREISAMDIESANIDELLRDTILNATPEFQELASQVVNTSNQLTEQYGADVSGLSNEFAQSIKSYATTYSDELETLKSQTGTIDQDILARETGANVGGVSSSFAEARKQMSGDLARRGLAGSGVEAQTLQNSYTQEAMAKANAMMASRGSALQQSEAMRQTQAGYAGQIAQTGMGAEQSAYQSQMAGIQNVYGVTSANLQQGLQTTNAATLQGIGGLTQAAQAGQGLYAGAQNYLAQASSSAGQAAQIAGNSAAQMGQMNDSWALAQQEQSNAGMAGIGSLVGTLGGAFLGGPAGASIGASMFGGE